MDYLIGSVLIRLTVSMSIVSPHHLIDLLFIYSMVYLLITAHLKKNLMLSHITLSWNNAITNVSKKF